MDLVRSFPSGIFSFYYESSLMLMILTLGLGGRGKPDSKPVQVRDEEAEGCEGLRGWRRECISSSTDY
jgi:hypothetical protein